MCDGQGEAPCAPAEWEVIRTGFPASATAHRKLHCRRRRHPQLMFSLRRQCLEEEGWILTGNSITAFQTENNWSKFLRVEESWSTSPAQWHPMGPTIKYCPPGMFQTSCRCSQSWPTTALPRLCNELNTLNPIICSLEPGPHLPTHLVCTELPHSSAQERQSLSLP